MVREGKATTNPLARLTPLYAAAGGRHQRRAFDDSEVRALLDAASVGPVRESLTGHQRYWLYRLAVETGVRASELQSLTRRSPVVDGDNPSVTVQAAFSSRRREDVLPLRQGTAVETGEFLGKKLPTVSVFALSRVDTLAKGWPRI